MARGKGRKGKASMNEERARGKEEQAGRKE